MKLKQYIFTIIGFSLLQFIIVASAWVLWNLVVPGVTGWTKINLLQIIILYALFNLFRFNWIKAFIDNNLHSKIERNGKQ